VVRSSQFGQAALFAAFIVASAVYFTVLMFFALRYNYSSTAMSLFGFQALGWVLPAVVCGAIQHSVSRRAGVAASRLWYRVAASAIGAPLVGVLLALAVFLVLAKLPA
jgi:hypothetical protein